MKDSAPPLVVFIASMATACASKTSTTIADGNWHDLPQRIRVIAAGTQGNGGVWFVGTDGALIRVEADGRSRTQKLPIIAFDAAANPTGDVWLVGTGKTTRMFRVAVDGTTQVDRAVPFEISAQTYDLTVVDGGAVAVGVHNPVTSGLTHAWTIAVDDDGALRYEKRLGTSGYSYFSAVTDFGDGTTAAVGRIEGQEQVAFVSRDGSVDRQGPLFGQGRTHVEDASEIDDDVVVLGFSIDKEDVGGFEGRVAVERRGRDGTVRWTRRTETVVSQLSDALTVRGEILALASAPDPGELGGTLLLLRIQSDGTISTQPLDGPARSSMTEMCAFLMIGSDGGPWLVQVDGLTVFKRLNAPSRPRFRLLPLQRR